MKPAKLLSALSGALLLFTSARAQHNMGIATSEWSATNSLYLNPASIAGSHEKVTISLVSLNMAVDNNLGTFPSISDISKINSNDTGNAIFKNADRQHFSMVIPAVELRCPGVLVAINEKMSVALTTRVRIISQLNNFDQSLYSQVTSPRTPNSDYAISARKFNWTAHLWSEMGLSYGAVVMDNDKGQIKAGITLRRLSGAGYVGLKANNLDLKYSSGKDSFYADHADLEFASNVVSARSAVFSGIDASSLFGKLFDASQGSGLGADIGVTYTKVLHFDGDSHNNEGGHKLTGGLSIVDMGAINYKRTNFVMNISGNGYLSGAKLNEYQADLDSLKAYAIRQGFHADTSSRPTKVHMPTALVLSADYQVYKHVSVNATYIANLVSRQQFGSTVYNQLTVTPRYDTHVFTVGLPITYSSLAGNMKVGLGLRVGGFFLGSDDMLALVSSNQYGVNIYFGGYVPICRKNKDKEGLHSTN